MYILNQIPIIKVDAIDSTNSYAKRLLAEKKEDANFCVFTEYQKEGKGQVGAKWISEPYQNLTCSIAFQHLRLAVEDAFYVSIITSLILKRVLKSYHIPQVLLKWPNDILSGRTKIGGILIENNIQKGVITSTVIGIGLNINQLNFESLPKASSLKKIMGIHYPIEEVLESLLKEFLFLPTRLNSLQRRKLLDKYMRSLFRFQKVSMFQRLSGEIFVGIIYAVSSDGKLVVHLEDGIEEHFEVKQIKLLY